MKKLQYASFGGTPHLPRPAELTYAERDGNIWDALAIRNRQRVDHLLDQERAAMPRYGTTEARATFPERSNASETTRESVAAIIARHDVLAAAGWAD